MKRLLLYVHYNKYNQLSDHVVYQLKKMRSLFSRVIFISNSQLSEKDLAYLKQEQLLDDFIQRANQGFDFAAWHDGMEYIGFNQLSDYDNITTMNDTCFGPLHELAPYYSKYEQDESVDFWGITNHREFAKYPEHLQSYFIAFNKQLINAQVFYDFWKEVVVYTDVQHVINSYETTFTQKFIDAGFKYQAIVDTLNLDASGLAYPDFSYWDPRTILINNSPFIKVKAVGAHHGISNYLLDYIDKKTDYPTNLIINHMSMIDIPDYSYLLARKYLGNVDKVVDYTKKIAIHLHVFYVDLLLEFLDVFKNYHFKYDLFITTDSNVKENEIQKILDDNNYIAKIMVSGNKGRDIYPMLLLKDDLINYDIIGHFHTKKSKEADFFAGESWRTELINMLVKPADNIINNFEVNKNLGIVIADIPSFFRFNTIVQANNEAEMIPTMNELWHRMKMKKALDFNRFNVFTMSYGTFMWVRKEAIQPLFDLHISDHEIPEEPLPQNTILHAIERLLIYISWGQNYDFLISRNFQLTPFIDNRNLNNRSGFQELGLRNMLRILLNTLKKRYLK